MTDSFFGFDTDLSAIGSLELEDGPEEVDEYNDETFGTEADVWQEESHELAAELLERERQRHLPVNSHTSSLTAPPAAAAAVESMGADRLANKLGRLPVLSESELLSTTGSLTHSVPHAVVSPARAPAPTIFPAPFSVSPALPATAKVRTVAELERDMMLADSVDKLTCSAPAPQPPPPPAQLPPPPQPLPPTPTAAAAVHSLASGLDCVLPDLTRPPPSLPAPFRLPTGSSGGVTNMRTPALAVRQPPLAAADPFRGLMTNKDRQWLLNIQRLQVQSNDDYYFKHFKTRKLRGLLASGVKANNNNNNNASGGGGGGVLHEKNGERTTVHLEKRDYVPPVIENTLGKLRVASVTAPRRIIDVHAPADDDSDGRTVDCRRETKRDRLILLTIEQLYVDLLTVEHDECDADTADNNNKTTHTSAAAASNNNNNSCSVDTSAVARPDEAAGDCQQNQQQQQQQQDQEEKRVTSRRCWSRLVAALHDRDTLAAILCVAKGKKLMLRVLAHVPHSAHHHPHQQQQQQLKQQQLELEQLLVATLYAHLSRCVVKDRCSLLLHSYYHLVQTVLDRADLAQLNQYAADLSTDLDVSTLSISSASPFCSLVSSSFGVSAVVSLLLCGQQLYQDTDPTTSSDAASTASAPCHRSVWSGLFTRLVTALNVVSQRVAPPLRPFSGALLSTRLPLSRHLLVTLSAAD